MPGTVQYTLNCYFIYVLFFIDEKPESEMLKNLLKVQELIAKAETKV